MKRRWMVFTFLLVVALPSIVFGRWKGKDKVYLQTESVGEVEFSHYKHMDMESIRYNCPTCHEAVFKLEKKDNPTYTMKQMEEGKSCGHCHNDTQAFSVTGDCTTCHTVFSDLIKGSINLQTESVGKVEFSHSTHFEMESIGQNCRACHDAVFNIVKEKNPAFTMKQMDQGQACGYCHNGKQVFNVTGDCTTCHAGDVVYVVEDTGNVTFPHEAHIDMFGCDECHPDLFKAEKGANEATMAEMQDGESCGACHDGSTAFGVSEECGSCHAM